VHVFLTQGGKAVMDTDCDAPWLLVKAPAGSYGVSASQCRADGAATDGQFTTSGLGGAQKTITLTFPRLPPLRPSKERFAERPTKQPSVREGRGGLGAARVGTMSKKRKGLACPPARYFLTLKGRPRRP